ncbi:MAG: DUF3800 domain-containing protein [Methanothrix sp.]|uniref:DUF3800 domain-containing protein n=1 Tax=Methanothrix sp. TaxID=90426 RepID=UPI003BB5B332
MKVYIDESGNLGGLGAKVSEEDPYFFIAGAIARKYRDNDNLYYNKIQHKIIMALEFFESK